LQKTHKNKHKKRQESIQPAAPNATFYIGKQQIKKVEQFKYWWRIITTNDDDLQAVEKQLGKARKVWARIGKLVKQHTNNNPNVFSSVYKTIIMSVLLYGAESWVINATIMVKLKSFHNCCARSITGRHIKLLEDGPWEYPSITQTLKMAKLLSIDIIKKRKKTVSAYVQTTALYQECQETLPAAYKFNTILQYGGTTPYWKTMIMIIYQ
jgi:hypothetical protein